MALIKNTFDRDFMEYSGAVVLNCLDGKITAASFLEYIFENSQTYWMAKQWNFEWKLCNSMDILQPIPPTIIHFIFTERFFFVSMIYTIHASRLC